MACLKTLPLLEGAKLIILDEGLEAMYGRTLIAGWLQMWTNKDSNRIFELLSFFDPKSWYQNEPEPFMLCNVNIHDFCTLNINEVQQRDSDTLNTILHMDKTKSIVIVDCLSSLIVYVGLAKALWFLERLSRQAQQVICIYRRDIVQNKPPKIETLGTTYIKLGQFSGKQRRDTFTYMVEIIHRKVGGSILRQSEIVNQDATSYEIQSEKAEAQAKKVDQGYDNPKEKIQSSFRIEMNASEMEQREKTVLPYTINSNTTNSSKIFYQPDDVDDIDEEDPDDDLCI